MNDDRKYEISVHISSHKQTLIFIVWVCLRDQSADTLLQTDKTDTLCYKHHS